MIQIKQSRLLATILGFAGIVIYPTIYVIDKNKKKLIYHELIHIAQIHRLINEHGKKGVRLFYWRYFRDWVLKGFRYRKIPYEVEAIKYENDFLYLEINDPEIWEEIKHLMIK
jgi:hypothetical protein